MAHYVRYNYVYIFTMVRIKNSQINTKQPTLRK